MYYKHNDLLKGVIMADPAVNKEVEIAKTEAGKLAEQATGLKIRTEEDLKQATAKLVEVKRVSKDIEKRRKVITQPLNLAIKEVNALFKVPSDSLAEAEKVIKDAMLLYHERMEKRATKRAEKIEGQVDAGEMGLADGMAKLSGIKQAPGSVDTGDGMASYKVVTRVRIVNPAELPAKYFLRERVLEALRVEVEEDVRKNGEEVPAGAEVYQDRQVAVRT